MNGIAVNNLKKSYPNGFKALDQISFEILDGEFAVLLGPSGCGKSTALRIIAGLDYADSGEIFIAGKLVNELDAKDRDIGMVFQSYALYPHFTVYENIAFPLKMRKVHKSEIKEAVTKAAKFVEIEKYLDRKPKELSGGQRQRVALARAIVRKPKAFLFDEPLSNLDAALRVNIRAELQNLHKKLGITTLYVTHDQVEAMTLADKVILMNSGQVEQIGTPNELYNNPFNLFVANFLGSPSINKITVSIKNEMIYCGDTSLNLKVDIQDTETSTLAFRPESIFLDEKSDLKAVLKFVENHGHEKIAFFEFLGHEISIRLGNETISKDKLQGIRLNSDKIFIFDTNGNRIV